MRLSIPPALLVWLAFTPHVVFPQTMPPEVAQESSPPASEPEQVASDASVRAYLAELLRLAGGGYHLRERAAFLVADRGGYRCVLWPYHTAVQGEVFRGRIPSRAVAVVHTHPNSIPRPSPEDWLEARRLGLPFIVVSARNIYAVTRTGQVAAVVENEWWADRVERRPAEGCEALEASGR